MIPAGRTEGKARTPSRSRREALGRHRPGARRLPVRRGPHSKERPPIEGRVFTSLAILLDVRGTYGRSQVRVGRGVHDVIESDNVVVRCDCSVVGHVSRILTESPGLEGRRQIIGMLVDDQVREVESLVARWIDGFESKGTAIAGVDLADQGLQQMVRANVELGARRVSANLEARERAKQLGRGATLGELPPPR